MNNELQLPKYPPVLFVRATEIIRRGLIRIYRKFTHPNVAMLEVLQNLWLLGALRAATELGIADLLKEGPKTIDELAKLSGSVEGPLYRVMRGLASHGIFKESKNKMFSINPLAKSLQKEELKYFIEFSLSAMQFNISVEMIHSVKTGRNSTELFIKNGVFEHIGQSQEINNLYNKAMTSTSKMQVSAILPCFEFGKFRHIIDIAGGQGFLLSSILNRYKTIKGTVFELPQVINNAQQLIGDSEKSGKIEFVTGNFFESIPAGGDLYLLKNILHNWNDEDSAKILQNIRKVLPPNGRLLIIEMIVGYDNNSSWAKMMDLYMMIGLNGRERTREEYQALLEKAGYKNESIKRTVSPLSIIVAASVPEIN
jgi:ubiquinone/menaquinone biosynthesis C-methylase UbiE